MRLNLRTRIEITGRAKEYISELVENHSGDDEDVHLIADDLLFQVMYIDRRNSV